MSGDTLVTWPDTLRAAQSEGFTHFRLRATNRGDGLMMEPDRPFAVIEHVLSDVADFEHDFRQRSECVELPTVRSMVLDGPFAGAVVAMYLFVRRPSRWERLRAPEV
jgi:hypothetical protein